METPKIVPLTTFILVVTSAIGTTDLRAQDSIQPFPLNEVRLLDSPFKQAQEQDRQYMLKLDTGSPSRSFFAGSGFAEKGRVVRKLGKHRLGWTHGGALSLRAGVYVRVYGRPRDAQAAQLHGHRIGGMPEGQWQRLRRRRAGEQIVLGLDRRRTYGRHQPRNGSPGITCTKLLPDCAMPGWSVGTSRRKRFLISFADWCANTVSRLSDDQMQQMLKTEYGGMNEVLADVYAITGDKKYLELAKRFDHQFILAPLEASQDRLDGLHANTPDTQNNRFPENRQSFRRSRRPASCFGGEVLLGNRHGTSLGRHRRQWHERVFQSGGKLRFHDCESGGPGKLLFL